MIVRNEFPEFHHPKSDLSLSDTTESIIVSVILTAYNRSEFIHEAINSILLQDYPKEYFELIIASNFEVDLDLQVFDKFRVRRILIEATVGETLNQAINVARGEFIAFIDDDDLWEKDKLSRIVEVFANNEQVTYYHNSITYIDRRGIELKYSRAVERGFARHTSQEITLVAKDPKGILTALSLMGDFNLSSIALRSNHLREYTQYISGLTSNPDGFFFWANLLSNGCSFIDQKKLTRYRVHDRNVSRNRNLLVRAFTIKNEIGSFDILLDYSIKSKLPQNILRQIIKWIALFKLEFDLTRLIFAREVKREILSKAIQLAKFPLAYRNPFRFRILILSTVYLFSSSVALYIYKGISL